MIRVFGDRRDQDLYKKEADRLINSNGKELQVYYCGITKDCGWYIFYRHSDYPRNEKVWYIHKSDGRLHRSCGNANFFKTKKEALEFIENGVSFADMTLLPLEDFLV